MSETGAWMPLYWGDYLSDTTHLTTEEHGAYFLLIGSYWRRGRALPDDDDFLAATTKSTKFVWRKLRNKLSPFFEISNGIWTHKRIEKEILRCSGRLKSARANGRAGGLATKQRAGRRPPTQSQSQSQSHKQQNIKDPPTPQTGGYAFEGKVIKLKQEDFNRWQEAYPHLNGTMAGVLTSRDDWYAQPENEQARKRWFQATSQWLAKLNQEAHERTPKKHKPISNVMAGTPEFYAMYEMPQPEK